VRLGECENHRQWRGYFERKIFFMIFICIIRFYTSVRKCVLSTIHHLFFSLFHYTHFSLHFTSAVTRRFLRLLFALLFPPTLSVGRTSHVFGVSLPIAHSLGIHC